MNWFEKIIQGIKESDNQKYIDEIESLKKKLKILHENYAVCQKKFIECDIVNGSLITENNVLRKKLDNKKNVSDVLKPKNVAYKWKPNKNTLLRHSLNNFSEDVEYKAKYVNWLIQQGMNPKEDSEYDVVIKTFLTVMTWWKKNRKYITDDKNYGFKEYWLTPQEAFDIIVMGNKGDDCDGLRSLMYGAIVAALDLNGYTNDNLYCADVNIIGREGHAILQWWNGEQFITLETTFANERAYKVISSERDITKSVYTDVMRFFNEEQEFVLK